MLKPAPTSQRAGRFVLQPRGYRAFIPAPLPPDPPLGLDARLTRALSDADLALGRLDGATSVLPNPDLFVAMYVRREAVLSSQIEGTQASLADVLQFEVSEERTPRLADVSEVVNYVAAMRHGLSRLRTLPLSLRLIREIHKKLLAGGRGREREPGELRKTQNWIGPAGSTLATATFVPPPPQALPAALGALEHFLGDDTLPPLLHAGLAHPQFETIHPFRDGNGRVGRLLVTLLLCQRGVLSQPLLYLSHYLKRHRQEYYDRLQAVRFAGDWEGWLLFFLRGVAEVATEANRTAREILALREKHRLRLAEEGRSAANLLRALDLLFEQPLVTVRSLERRMTVTFRTANTLLERLERLSVIRETTGGARNRQFAFAPYLRLFDDSERKPRR